MSHGQRDLECLMREASGLSIEGLRPLILQGPHPPPMIRPRCPSSVVHLHMEPKVGTSNLRLPQTTNLKHPLTLLLSENACSRRISVLESDV